MYSSKILKQGILQAKIHSTSSEREKEYKTLTGIYKYRLLLSIS